MRSGYTDIKLLRKSFILVLKKYLQIKILDTLFLLVVFRVRAWKLHCVIWKQCQNT